MIGQYLSNTSKKTTVSILQNILELNKALVPFYVVLPTMEAALLLVVKPFHACVTCVCKKGKKTTKSTLRKQINTVQSTGSRAGIETEADRNLP